MISRADIVPDAAAMSLMDRAVQLAPHCATALVSRVVCRVIVDLENASVARQDAAAARTLSGDSGPSLLVSAVADMVTGDLASARVWLEGVKRALPSDIANGWTAYATVAFNSGEEADALDAVDRALTAKPTNANALGRRAMLRFVTDDHEGARRDARDALSRDAKNAVALSVEAGLAFVRGDFQAAARRGNDALAEDPEGIVPLITVGWTAVESGDLVTARRRADDLRKLGITDEGDSIERRINELDSAGRRKPGSVTTVLERANALRNAIELVKFSGASLSVE